MSKKAENAEIEEVDVSKLRENKLGKRVKAPYKFMYECPECGQEFE